MEKKTNWFSRVLIIILIVFIVALVICSFILGNPKFSLTNEIIFLILLLVFLALSEIFDNFSIGNLIIAKKEKHQKEIELKEVKAENKELHAQLISIVSNSITNQNMNIFGLSKDGWVQMAGVEQSESSTIEEEKEKDLTSDNIKSASDARKCCKDLQKIENLAIDRFCIQYKIPTLSVVKEVKFSNRVIEIDPIMERNAIFDAYYKSLQEELFIEVKVNFRPASMNMYNLYYLLSKIDYYRKANQLNAKMILILADLPESYRTVKHHFDKNEMISNIQETFAPAIKNNLLEIVQIELTENDLNLINSKNENQEIGSGD